MMVNRARMTVTITRARPSAVPRRPGARRAPREAVGEVDRRVRGGEEADDGQPELGDREEPAGILEQPAHAASAGVALLGELLDPAAADRDQGDLRGDEEALEQGQQDDDEESSTSGPSAVRRCVGSASPAGPARAARARAAGGTRVAHPGGNADGELAGRHVLRDDGARRRSSRRRRPSGAPEHRVDAEEDPPPIVVRCFWRPSKLAVIVPAPTFVSSPSSASPR
jgi:hypothetical protein